MADFSFEDECAAPSDTICGIDEVGRGPLAGPVVAACVIIPKGIRVLNFIDEIKDSKKLGLKKREELYKAITENCIYAIAEITPQEIDQINILQATMKAMKTAHDQIPDITHALIDGNRAPLLSSKTRTVIKGDQKSKSIAAASIIAKVHRDRIMKKLAAKYPYYGWEKNTGYPTKRHQEAMKVYGITPVHRKSFAPVRKIIESQQ